ncbi:hypothetical protein ACWEQA_24140 [Nocardia sp. NPDC004085]
MTSAEQPQPYAAAGRALIALAAWASTREGTTVEQIYDNTYDQEVLGDFGADLLHLLHLHDVDIDEVRERAWRHFNEESTDQPTAGSDATTGPTLAAIQMLSKIVSQAHASGEGSHDEYTFDIYMLATVKVNAQTLPQARRMLCELTSHDVPDAHARIADGVEVTVLEYRGIADMLHRVPDQRGEPALRKTASRSWNVWQQVAAGCRCCFVSCRSLRKVKTCGRGTPRRSVSTFAATR